MVENGTPQQSSPGGSTVTSPQAKGNDKSKKGRNGRRPRRRKAGSGAGIDSIPPDGDSEVLDVDDAAVSDLALKTEHMSVNESASPKEDLGDGQSTPPERLGSGTKASAAPENTDEDSEDDWEKALDADEDLSAKLEAKIPKPSNGQSKSPKKPPNHKPPDVSEDIETTAIEVYGFPETFKTHDIQNMYKEHESTGFKIKWIDDTSCLVIFTTSSIAKAAYVKTLSNPFVKVKPHTGPVPVVKPKESEERGPRPVTTDMVARRLVAGALGLPTRKKTQEEIERDRKKLEEAKAQRDAQRAAKLKKEEELEAAWD
ncbi:hypothetical protein BJ742DRAFT_768192 [Cladochytrium replicatum]|nr:hypothetical protein BJ742DRAFT_768192 [Cladochytrium replicatum]